MSDKRKRVADEARIRATADRRLIEHYLPIEAISAEARREKSVRVLKVACSAQPVYTTAQNRSRIKRPRPM